VILPMSKARVQAAWAGISSSIQYWCSQTNYRLASYSESTSRQGEQCCLVKNYGAKSKFNEATWRYCPVDRGIMVVHTVKPRAFLQIILLSTMYGGLLYCTTMCSAALSRTDQQGVVYAAVAVATMFVMLVKYQLSRRLALLERSYWNHLMQLYDVEPVERIEIGTVPGRAELCEGLAISLMAIYMATRFAGIYGFVISTLPCAILLSMSVLRHVHRRDCHWHWRLWIIDNMVSWTLMMLVTFGAVSALLLTELLLPRMVAANKPAASLGEALHTAQFRDVHPPTGEALENDCNAQFLTVARRISRRAAFGTDVNEVPMNVLRQKVRYLCLPLGIVFVAAVSFFAFWPFLSIVRRQKLWAAELTSSSTHQQPHVPYTAEAWRWRTPFSMRALILLHGILGGLINVVVAMFFVESLSYVISGQTLLFDRTANLLSWIFAVFTILGGPYVGRPMALLVLSVINLPSLFLFGTFLRRGMGSIRLLVRILFHRLHKASPAQDKKLASFIKETCVQHGLKTPLLVLTADDAIVLRLRQLPLARGSLIEISQGTMRLLTAKELRAAIAHEIGHMRQGLWRMSILKSLSSLALFPNYYLTLCVDWARKEIDADSFAVMVTEDPSSLKQALIKISAAQLKYRAAYSNETSGFIGCILMGAKQRLSSLRISIQFFLGDRLFGYAHPYLSERLAEIDNS